MDYSLYWRLQDSTPMSESRIKQVGMVGMTLKYFIVTQYPVGNWMRFKDRNEAPLHSLF